MSVENYAYMRQLWQHQRKLQDQEMAEHIGHIRPQSSSSTGRPSSEQSSLQLQRSGSGSETQEDRRPPTKRRLARIFFPARRRRTKSLEGRVADLSLSNCSGTNDDHISDKTSYISPPAGSKQQIAPLHSLSSSQHTAPIDPDPAKHIFRLCSGLVTNPFSPCFELNPLLLNITHPLLSNPHRRRRHLRVLDLGGIEDSVYTNTIATLPHAAVCQFTQAQLSAQFPPPLPFKSKGFDVITTSTLYKFVSNPHRPPTPGPFLSTEHTLRSCVQEIYRILDRSGSFEFLFFDRQLSHAGPLTREMEPFLYQDDRYCKCRRAQDKQTGSVHLDACACQATPTPEPVTGAQFLEILASEGFITEKSTTLMFPLSLLSIIFTRDGQRLRGSRGDSEHHQPDVTPLLTSLMKTIYEECRTSQTAWRCIIGSALKR
ncbi:hypothetical protein BDW59DRAFT_159950 [Aspergillus cavernicola]|uniref:Methyltransferase type 11 domain-containing protein n=1 Tax=Aspergillus cavernicola TaxID=176166 RepID=A0ABR4IJP4_9EURO